MTLTVEALPHVPARPQPLAPTPPAAPGRVGHLTLVGDLTCPWSYLAARRAARLEAAGVDVDWWMVEHDRPVPGRPVAHDERRLTTLRDLDQVTARLLPGERLPHAFTGPVPFTRPAVSGYAEAYLAGVGSAARQLLFEAFWMHGVDLGDARTVRMLLADVVRGGASGSELVREWGYAVDVTGAPVTGDAARLVRRWRAAWSRGGEVVPVLVDEDRRWYGGEVLDRLADHLLHLGLDPAAEEGPPAQPSVRTANDLADLPWATAYGNPWLRDRRVATTRPVLERLRPWV